MSIKELITEQYGSVDNFVEQTDVQISRTYLYQLVNDDTVNPSLKVIEELARVLGKSVEQIVQVIYSTRHRD